MLAPDRPAALVVAVAITAAEVVGLLIYAVVIVVRALGGDASSPANSALLAALVLVWAAGLVVAARGLLGGRSWARSPLIVNQLLTLAVGVPLIQGSVALVGWPLVVCSVVALGALVALIVDR